MKKSIFVIFFLSMLTYSEENFLKAGIGGLFRKDIYKNKAKLLTRCCFWLYNFLLIVVNYYQPGFWV